MHIDLLRMNEFVVVNSRGEGSILEPHLNWKVISVHSENNGKASSFFSLGIASLLMRKVNL